MATAAPEKASPPRCWKVLEHTGDKMRLTIEPASGDVCCMYIPCIICPCLFFPLGYWTKVCKQDITMTRVTDPEGHIRMFVTIVDTPVNVKCCCCCCCCGSSTREYELDKQDVGKGLKPAAVVDYTNDDGPNSFNIQLRLRICTAQDRQNAVAGVPTEVAVVPEPPASPSTNGRDISKHPRKSPSERNVIPKGPRVIMELLSFATEDGKAARELSGLINRFIIWGQGSVEMNESDKKTLALESLMHSQNDPKVDQQQQQQQQPQQPQQQPQPAANAGAQENHPAAGQGAGAAPAAANNNVAPQASVELSPAKQPPADGAPAAAAS